MTPVTDDFSWFFRVLNPCTRTNFVNIESPGLDEVKYIIYDSRKVYQHDRFTLDTGPLPGHNLCGPLVYEGRYQGSAVPESGGDPVSYNPGNRKFFIKSEDESLIDTIEPYSVYVTLRDYPPSLFPDVTTFEATEYIDFNNPCDNPFLFELPNKAQRVPSSTSYGDNDKVRWALRQFRIQPELCTITYTCTSVTKQGFTGATQPITCSDLTFDGVINGQTSDGILEFKPTGADYVSGKYPPGLYDIVITGTENEATNPESLSVTITMELIDPCTTANLNIREGSY